MASTENSSYQEPQSSATAVSPECDRAVPANLRQECTEPVEDSIASPNFNDGSLNSPTSESQSSSPKNYSASKQSAVTQLQFDSDSDEDFEGSPEEESDEDHSSDSDWSEEGSSDQEESDEEGHSPPVVKKSYTKANRRPPGWRHKNQQKKYQGRRRFTNAEKNAIREGVSTFGVGKWAQIKKRHSDVLRIRTSTQIKVRARRRG